MTKKKKPVKKGPSNNTVTNCTFKGSDIIFSEGALRSVQTIADALYMNASALHTLAQAFRGDMVSVEALLTFGK